MTSSTTSPFLPCTVHFRIGICLGIHGHRLTVHYQRSFSHTIREYGRRGRKHLLYGALCSTLHVHCLPKDSPFPAPKQVPLVLPVCSQCICTVQVAINPFRTQCISIILRLTKRTQCIGRTTETTDIFRPFFRPTECIRQIGTDTKRIRIEILLSIQAYATQYTIIKASFHKPAYLASPVTSSMRQLNSILPMLAQVSLCAVLFGN